MGTAVIIDGCIEATQEAKYEPMNHSTKSNADHIRSWYAATAHTLPNCRTLEESIDADVCVVGGGFTALTAALTLSRAGYRVALVESRPDRCGDGYHRNNGGLRPFCSSAPAGFSRWDTVTLAQACRRYAVLQPSRSTLRGSVLSNLCST